MSFYECVFIVRQDVSSAQVEQFTEQFSSVIRSGDGEVKKTEMWGLKTLSFKIKKNRKGYYVLLNIDAPAPAVAELDRILKLNEDVLRHLIVRTDVLQEGPSVMMQCRGDRDRGERGGRRFEGREGREGGGFSREGREGGGFSREGREGGGFSREGREGGPRGPRSAAAIDVI